MAGAEIAKDLNGIVEQSDMPFVLSIGALQAFLDEQKDLYGEIDYVHGEDAINQTVFVFLVLMQVCFSNQGTVQPGGFVRIRESGYG